MKISTLPALVVQFRAAMHQSEAARTKAMLALVRGSKDRTLWGSYGSFRKFLEHYALGTWSSFARFRMAAKALPEPMVTTLGVTRVLRIAWNHRNVWAKASVFAWNHVKRTGVPVPLKDLADYLRKADPKRAREKTSSEVQRLRAQIGRLEHDLRESRQAHLKAAERIDVLTLENDRLRSRR